MPLWIDFSGWKKTSSLHDDDEDEDEGDEDEDEDAKSGDDEQFTCLFTVILFLPCKNFTFINVTQIVISLFFFFAISIE